MKKGRPADINAKSSRGECQHENFLTTTAAAELLAKVLTDRMKLVQNKTMSQKRKEKEKNKNVNMKTF